MSFEQDFKSRSRNIRGFSRSSLNKDNIFLILTIIPSESIVDGRVFTPILLPSYCCCGFSPSFLSFSQHREGGWAGPRPVTSVSSLNTRPLSLTMHTHAPKCERYIRKIFVNSMSKPDQPKFMLQHTDFDILND